MYRSFRISSVIVLIVLTIFSCRSRQQILLDTVNSLIGKQLIFPQELIVFNDIDHLGKESLHDEGYKILIYLNPYTCSACKVKEMRLWDGPWKEFQEQGVPTIVLIDTDDMLEYKKEVDLQKVKPLFVYDVAGQFMPLNKLPENPDFQSYLLKGETIVLVGNPYMNPRLFELFLKEIEQ